MVPWAHPSPYPEQHLDRFIRFCMSRGRVQQTNTHRDRRTHRPRYFGNSRLRLTLAMWRNSVMFEMNFQVQEQLEAKRKEELEELERQKELARVEEEKRRAEEERLREEERKEMEMMRQREHEAVQWPWHTCVLCTACSRRKTTHLIFLS